MSVAASLQPYNAGVENAVMVALDFLRRPRAAALAVALSLLLAFGAYPLPVARAQSAPSAPTLQRGAAAPAAQSDVASLAEAYVLLLEHYAVPLDAGQLVAAGADGMVAALREAGVDVPPTVPATYGTGSVEQFAALQEEYWSLARRYADALAPLVLAHAAIQGMASSVGDPHTSYFSPEEYQDELRWQRGEAQYAGIGVRLQGALTTIVEVFPDSPASRAGLQPGDTIIAVNGQLTSDLKLAEVVKLVRGPEGAPLVLGVQRANGGGVDAITLTRAEVAAPLVSARRVAGDVGYVQLRGFPNATVVPAVIQAIQQQQAAGVRGIVLDLRGNAGGRVAVGEQLLAAFVPNGPIYQSVTRDGRRDVHNVSNARPLLTVPLAVIVDGGTASMGEIFAAAIRERGVGRVVGQPTAGAVAASRIIPLTDGSALQLSVEQVYSGAGALLDRVGVQPDEEVALDLDALRQGRDTQLERAVSAVLAAPGPDSSGEPPPIRLDLVGTR
jgi:carboxyl-terminal processing protease